ncbi:MAG: hypothetical protein IH934_04850 [Nanoarchaeota archaeon]|nr:hypothetical protein [Nanoarchaeota archaeon]
MKILFRTAGGIAKGEELGLGHVYRCLNLAKFMKQNQIHFFVEDFGGVKNILKKNGFDKIILLKKNPKIEYDVEKIRSYVKRNKIDIVIVDRYKIKKRYVSKIRKFVKTVVISDLKDIEFDAGLVVNGFIGFKNKIIKNRHKTKCLIGPKYQILSKKFQKKKNNRKKEFKLLATFGGYDEQNIGLMLIRCIVKNKLNIKVKLVLGPSSRKFNLKKLFSNKFEYKILLYPFIGIFLGLVINPYFPNNISLLYTQIFKVNLIANLFNVEWKPWPFFEFIKNNILVLFYIFISIFILIINKKITKLQSFYFSLTIFFFIYTIISRRMQEYLVPFSILTVSLLLNFYLIKFEKNKSFNYHGNQRFPGYRKSSIFAYVKSGAVLFLIIIVITNFFLLRQDISNNDFLFNYNNCAEWMKNNIPKNSLVFTNAYAFPYLFSKNSDLIYTHGIDLTYSYLYEPEKFERYMGILQGTLKDNVDYIKEDYSPDYVFSGKIKQDVQLFNYIINNKQNYDAVYEDEWCAVLEVK